MAVHRDPRPGVVHPGRVRPHQTPGQRWKAHLLDQALHSELTRSTAPNHNELIGAALGPYTVGEQTLIHDLLTAFAEGMVVLADRNFLSHTLARDVLATGAHILWRASASFRLTPIQVLGEGTYLAKLNPARKADGAAITVRVIEYTVHTTPAGGTGVFSEVFALVTDLLDIEAYPALDLACAYPMHWQCETVIGHHKTDMGQGMAVLRSQDPEGVAPQMLSPVRGLPGGIHTLIGAAVDTVGILPDKISFPHALGAATDTVSAAFPPHDLDLAVATFLLKILDPGFFVRDRPDRASPRRTKKAGDFPARKQDEPSVVTVTRRIQLHSLRPRPSG